LARGGGGGAERSAHSLSRQYTPSIRAAGFDGSNDAKKTKKAKR